jgi:hypothetical protein
VIKVYPGGEEVEEEEGGVSIEHISIFLYSQSQTSNIHIEFEFAAANSKPIPTNYKFNREWLRQIYGPQDSPKEPCKRGAGD